eukprot:scaffold2861_cov107-Isochrysis_galbana.AAC.3
METEMRAQVLADSPQSPDHQWGHAQVRPGAATDPHGNQTARGDPGSAAALQAGQPETESGHGVGGRLRGPVRASGRQRSGGEVCRGGGTDAYEWGSVHPAAALGPARLLCPRPVARALRRDDHRARPAAVCAALWPGAKDGAPGGDPAPGAAAAAVLGARGVREQAVRLHPLLRWPRAHGVCSGHRGTARPLDVGHWGEVSAPPLLHPPGSRTRPRHLLSLRHLSRHPYTHPLRAQSLVAPPAFSLPHPHPPRALESSSAAFPRKHPAPRQLSHCPSPLPFLALQSLVLGSHLARKVARRVHRTGGRSPPDEGTGGRLVSNG